MSKHTTEPWKLAASGLTVLAGPPDPNGGYPNGIALATTPPVIPLPMRQANARRIVACVNACHDVSTKYLQTRSVRDLVLDLDEARQRNTELLAACEAALRHIQAEVEEEVHTGQDGRACRLHDLLLGAIARARGETPPA